VISGIVRIFEHIPDQKTLVLPRQAIWRQISRLTRREHLLT
jgi:hypothetical protein